MRPFLRSAILALVVLPATAPEILAQTSRREDPYLGYVYPGGGQPGTSVDVIVGGQVLEGVNDVYISGGGAKATITRYFLHIDRGRYIGLRQRRLRVSDLLIRAAARAGKLNYRPTQDEILKACAYTELELEQMADYQRRDAEPRRQINPQLSEEVWLNIKIDKEAKPGERELRLIMPTGMSNPLRFFVSQVPECREIEPNDQVPSSTVRDQLPMVLNGQIMPGDVDRFNIFARKGQHLVFSAAARALMPYLADAVPGWFQAVIALYGPQGNEVAYAGEFGWRQDPVMYYEVPEDGTYVIEIHDSIYRGREDFVYRITVGELPFVTHVFPLGGRAGTQVSVDLMGWNLPVENVKLDNFYDRGKPVRSISVKGPEFVSNNVSFAVDMQPEIMEQEPNNDPATAQPITLPVIINGRIDQPDDCDTFSFEGRANEKVVAEVVARRLGSPLDSLLKLFTSEGKQIAVNDDYEDKASPLATHHADSRIEVKLPANGSYYLRLYDAQRQGGPEFGYRLQVRPPRPDYELRVVPSSMVAKAASSVPIVAHALRKDGFMDDIYLELEKAPPGFRLSGEWIPAGKDEMRLTLDLPPNPTGEPIPLDLQGRATVHGTRIVRPGVPADAMMQAFYYWHLVPARNWAVNVTGKAGSKPEVAWLKEVRLPDRVRINAGKSVTLKAAAPGKKAGDKNSKVRGELYFELSEPPDGFSIKKTNTEAEAAAIVVQTESEKVRPGQKGNLLFLAFWDQSTTNTEGKVKEQRAPLGMLPALPYEIIKP